jgi:nitrate/nitrite-specific signal transduction histidine kinase
MPVYQLAILVEQGTAEALAPLRQFATLLVVTSLGGLVVSALGVFFFTRRVLTGPLQSLTDGALRLAGGDLGAMVQIRRQDEIGLLADTFNSMATELRGLYQDLESKVEARTQQLEAAAEVGRAATSILSADELLARTVDLIRDRFGYYHVSIFMLDETNRWAVLQEATGEAGAQLKERGHRLAVGSHSLIGWVTANRQPRIALDVASDEVHFRNELLPDTRSEAALPLRVGERLIGALDVQSRSLNAFNQADIDVLQVLADQIAVAVENGRLFARQERAARLEQRVASLTARVHRSLTLDAILENAAAELGQTFGARKVVVRLTPEAQPAAANGGHLNGSNGANGVSGPHTSEA